MRIIVTVLAIGMLSCGCSDNIPYSRGVYVLMDPAHAAPTAPETTTHIINALLGLLRSNDTLAVARIDTEQFNDSDVAAQVTFGLRPSVTNRQKRAFAKTIGNFMAADENRQKGDISGGFWHAAEALRDARNGRRMILIYSDLQEKLVEKPTNDSRVNLSGYEVVALTIAPNSQTADSTRANPKRADMWRQQIENRGGRWRVAHSLDHLRRIIQE